MYSRCLDVFFSCLKSKKPDQSKTVDKSNKPLLEPQAQSMQSALELMSMDVASDVQAYLAQNKSKGNEAFRLITKKTLPELAAEMRALYKLYEQKRAEMSHFPQGNFPEYQAMEAAVKQAKEACFKAEKVLVEGMQNHKEYSMNFDGEDEPQFNPQVKF